ncbi:Uncharacterized protein Fot_03503 [Forsythia ovata]|uniref:Uncharacterized protein n=1 Tax=Forsythia ovata TaxID=205694 RepID=A0ABD1X9W5_9LAMI
MNEAPEYGEFENLPHGQKVRESDTYYSDFEELRSLDSKDEEGRTFRKRTRVDAFNPRIDIDELRFKTGKSFTDELGRDVDESRSDGREATTTLTWGGNDADWRKIAFCTSNREDGSMPPMSFSHRPWKRQRYL